MAGDIIDRFHRALNGIIEQKLAGRMEDLAGGSALSYDNYTKQVGYMQALIDVMSWAREIEIEIYGPLPQKKEDE